MIAALDIDITFKLHALRLYDDALASLGVDSVLVVPDARFSNGSGMSRNRHEKRVATYGESAVAATCALFDMADEVPTGAEADLTALAAVVGIDDGEVALIAAAVRLDGILLVTGDKRCLGALAASPALARFRASLLGRVVCLESLLLRLIRDCSFDYVNARVAPRLACDGAVRVAFGGASPSETCAVEALTAYLPADRALLFP